MSKKIMGLAVFLSLIAGGGIISFIDNETAYVCEDTQQVCIGRISSTGKTCYYIEDGIERWKRCLIEPYWQEYDNELVQDKLTDKVSIKADMNEWECEIENGFIHPYTRCTSKDGKEAYLGEKI